MIEKAIADWLTKTIERNYIPAFCQVLIHQGHTILYVSSHSQMERGKDIVTIGPDGTYHAYQTKTGDINKAAWRKNKGEFQELIEYPIDHPNVDKTKPYRAYLVTNGTINELVRLDITTMNEDNTRQNRRWATLEIIDHHNLVQQFVQAHQHFLPYDLPDIRDFLNLYLHDGRALLPKDAFNDALQKIIFAAPPKRPSDLLHAITASIIITSYLLAAFEQANNWCALIEGWSLLAASIIRYAKKHQLADKDWHPSLELTQRAINNHATALQNEAMTRKHWLEPPVHVDSDYVLCARTTIVLGTIAWHATRRTTQHTDDLRARIKQLFSTHEVRLWYWGESAFPYFFHIIRYCEQENEPQLAQELAEWLFTYTVTANYRAKQDSITSPYATIEESLQAAIAPEANTAASRMGNSYVVRSLLDMLLRRGWDGPIRTHWRQYTHCSQQEFLLVNPEDIFAWRNDDGTDQSKFPDPTDSITRLRDEARDRNTADPFLTPFSDFLGLHLIVCPFRTSPRLIGLLDEPSPMPIS